MKKYVPTAVEKYESQLRRGLESSHAVWLDVSNDCTLTYFTQRSGVSFDSETPEIVLMMVIPSELIVAVKMEVS